MKRIGIVSLVLLVTLYSCKKDGATTPVYYQVPSTYSFANFNDTTQLELLAMADQIIATINHANTVPNTVITTATLTNMLNNTSSPFNDSVFNLNGSGLSLGSYLTTAAKTDMLNYFDSIGVYSQSTVGGSVGIAGVDSSSVTHSKKYLLSPNGIFYSQVVKKSIMGLCANQIANVYMTDSINTSTDTAVLRHYWDAAFGFFGVPVSFPTTTTGLRYFGSYSNQVNAGLQSNSKIMNAFLTGRAAIVNNDLATMRAQANVLIHIFDTLNAACVVQEMHETNTNIEAGDAIAAYGTLSESLGFVRNFGYNGGTRVITGSQITQLLELYDNTNPGSPNLYNFVGVNAGLTISQIEAKTAAITQLINTIYGFNTTESTNL